MKNNPINQTYTKPVVKFWFVFGEFSRVWNSYKHIENRRVCSDRKYVLTPASQLTH